MGAPFFSIVTVCCNAGEGLQKTADLLRAQTCRDYEHIIKDAVSTDGSVDALTVDGPTRIISRNDDGIYDAMNQAVSEAKGRFVYFLNCGDRFADENLLADIKAAIIADEKSGNATSADVVYGNYVRDGMLNVQPNHLTSEYLYRRPLNHQSMFVSRELFRIIGGFDISMKIRADHEHTLRALKNGRRFLHLGRTVNVYEGGGYSEKPENREMRIAELEAIRSKYYSNEERRRLEKKRPRFAKKIRSIIFSKGSPKLIRKLYTGLANHFNK